ncbi:hypothetical protein PsorP6_002753 [Peronosclerospora sorghi]|uniref:Uncharacterized protein n=1 Tax=Peronosclerospora sorghi TaxID=230839 RepID=A0ACC0WP19_9STRA|nr:hypothetical protein PsorP6_002753 [Peronosclerospora sorghi]
MFTSGPALLFLPSLEKVVHVFHEDNLIRRALLQKLKHVTSCSSSAPQLLSLCEHLRVTDTPYFVILEIQCFREFMVVFGKMLGHHGVTFICTFTTLQSGTDLGRTLGSSNVVVTRCPLPRLRRFNPDKNQSRVSAIPSEKSYDAVKPSLLLAFTCEHTDSFTSPVRTGTFTIAADDPNFSTIRCATDMMEVLVPVHTLNTSNPPSSTSIAVRMARATSFTYTKSRYCSPSPIPPVAVSSLKGKFSGNGIPYVAAEDAATTRLTPFLTDHSSTLRDPPTLILSYFSGKRDIEASQSKLLYHTLWMMNEKSSKTVMSLTSTAAAPRLKFLPLLMSSNTTTWRSHIRHAFPIKRNFNER